MHGRNCFAAVCGRCAPGVGDPRAARRAGAATGRTAALAGGANKPWTLYEYIRSPVVE